MDSSSHTPACAYLACSEAFLSQGVEKLIRERHPKCDKLSSEDVCRLCCAVVHAQRGDVINNVQTLLARYNCMSDVRSNSFVNTEHEMLLDPADPKSLYTSCCEESLSTHGRSLMVNQSVSRGHILLKESPYAAVTCGHCTCAVGNVLSEHISLACAINQFKDRNAEKHAHFLRTFYSGLTKEADVHKVKSSDGSVGQYKHRPSTVLIAELMDEASIVRNGSHTWSLTTQILMALVCAIHSVHQTHLEYTSNNTDSVRVDNINKMRLFDSTWSLLQVLSRLPHNTHAISCVVANQGSTRYEIFFFVYFILQINCSCVWSISSTPICFAWTRF